MPHNMTLNNTDVLNCRVKYDTIFMGDKMQQYLEYVSVQENM